MVGHARDGHTSTSAVTAARLRRGTLLILAMVGGLCGTTPAADLAPVVPLDRSQPLGLAAPAVEPADQTFLMRLVRRSL
jgi:hypothetical protein